MPAFTDLSFSERMGLEVALSCLLSLSTALRNSTTFSTRSCRTSPLVLPVPAVTFLGVRWRGGVGRT